MTDDRQQSNTIHTHQAAGRSGAQTASDIARQGAEAMHRASGVAGEATRRSAQALAGGQRQLTQDAAEQFADVSQKVAQAIQDTTADLRTLAALPNAARGGLQDMQHSVAGLVEEAVRTNLRAADEVLRLYNPSAVIGLQQRLAREYLDMLMQGTATLVRAARRTADEALQPLEQQIEQRRQARQGEQRYQRAAE